MTGKIEEILLRKKTQTQLLKNPRVLSEAYLPDKLLFREKEIEEIIDHAGDFMFGSIPKNLVVHGPPGTGKTAAMMMIERVYNNVATKNNVDTRAIYISAKELTYHKVLYTLAINLNLNVNKGMSIGGIYDAILKHLKREEMRYLLIVDELDKIRRNTKMGDSPIDSLVYSLSRINERVQRIAVNLFLVTNNARLVERLSAPSLSSLAPIFIYFRSYNADELYEILKNRADLAFEEGAVDDAALKLLAALIKRESRDLRWGFLVLRTAASTAENGKITEGSIWRAAEIVERNVLKQVISGLDADGLLLLLALAVLSEKRNHLIDSSTLYVKYKYLCDTLEWPPRTMKHVINYIGAKLESEGLVTRRPVSKGRYGRTQIFHLEEDAVTVKNIVREVLAERFNLRPRERAL